MAKGTKHRPEQIVAKLRQIEVDTASGKWVAVSCKEAAITEQTCYRWRNEYGGLGVDLANPTISIHESSWSSIAQDLTMALQGAMLGAKRRG